MGARAQVALSQLYHHGKSQRYVATLQFKCHTDQSLAKRLRWSGCIFSLCPPLAILLHQSFLVHCRGLLGNSILGTYTSEFFDLHSSDMSILENQTCTDGGSCWVQFWIASFLILLCHLIWSMWRRGDSKMYPIAKHFKMRKILVTRWQIEFRASPTQRGVERPEEVEGGNFWYMLLLDPVILFSAIVVMCFPCIMPTA